MESEVASLARVPSYLAGLAEPCILAWFCIDGEHRKALNMSSYPSADVNLIDEALIGKCDRFPCPATWRFICVAPPASEE